MESCRGFSRVAAVAAVVAATTAMTITPASAGDPEIRQCRGYGGQASGVTTRHEGATYAIIGGCGNRMGVRVYYHSIGGWNWTSWKYVDPNVSSGVVRSVYPNNATYSEHFAGGTGTFISQFN